MEFYTQWNRPDKKEFLEPRNGEKWGPNLTEQSGWLPPGEQIARFQRAGVRLSDYRKAEWDFRNEQEVDEGFYDPTRIANFDMVDASNIRNNIVQKYEERRRAKTQKLQTPESPEDPGKSENATPEVQKTPR